MTHIGTMDCMAETLISGEWVIVLITGVITALAGAAVAIIGKIRETRGYQRGRTERVTLAEPVPDVPFKKVLTPPTWDQHKALMDRVTNLENVTIEMRRNNERQFQQLLEAGAMRENRLSDKLDEIANRIHARIDRQQEMCATSRCGQPHPKIPK